MFKDWLQTTDVRLGRRLSLRQVGYTTTAPPGEGVFTPEDWTRLRKEGFRGAGPDSIEFSTDAKYRRRMFHAQVRNTLAALRFDRTFDLSGVGTVLELGCGEMIQAAVLTTIHPHLRYIATDSDPFVVERCQRLETLRALEPSVLDASQLTAASLAGVDLVLSWEMIYALTDEQLSVIFRACREAGATFIAGTMQVLGPIRHLTRTVRGLWGKPAGRANGWLVSVGAYDRLARSCGMELAAVHHPPLRWAREDRFTYLVFKPNS